MKKAVILILSVILSHSVFSQSPQGFTYQAVVRDGAGEILYNQAIDFRLSIHDNAIAGPVIYQETHTANTNQFGLANLTVGQGTPTMGVFQDIVWGSGPKFLEVEVDLTGTFESLGATELLSVPYAFYDGDWTVSGGEMYTLNSGNIGIGTSTPAGKLDVRGANADDGALFYLGNVDRSHFIDLFPGREGDPNPFIRWKYSDPLRFSTDAGPFGFTELMRITPEGNLGIGTENPLSKLSVGGHGFTYAGIYGQSDSIGGIGVYGKATNTEITENYGGYFEAESNYGKGVYGRGGHWGGYFETDGYSAKGVASIASGPFGTGVSGIASDDGPDSNYGGHFTAYGEGGTGVRGRAISLYGNARGGWFSSEATGGLGVWAVAYGLNGIGVMGDATNVGDGYNQGGNFTAQGRYSTGVSGISTGIEGIGVYGQTNATIDAANYGGYFETFGDNGTGALGRAEGSSGIGITGDAVYDGNATNYGGSFGAYGTSGRAISGIAYATGGTNYGASLDARGANGRAVYGQASNTSGFNYGGYFDAKGEYGTGIYAIASSNVGSAETYGGYFESKASNGRGVFGKTDGTSGIAVSGVANYSGSGTNYGGYFEAKASSGRAVYGIASGNFGRAIMGVAGSAGATAGYFSGNVTVTGTLSKGGGSFKIDHPLDPTNKNLYHSFVESPDMMNIYNGNVILDENGAAIVILPDWFEALNMEFRYQLTAIGAPGPNLYISEEISGNRFSIAGGQPGSKVSWQVTGIRHDAFANANRIPLEEMKRPEDRGKYLHPDAFNQPVTAGVDYDEELENAKIKWESSRQKMQEERDAENIRLEAERERMEAQQKLENEKMEKMELKRKEMKEADMTRFDGDYKHPNLPVKK